MGADGPRVDDDDDSDDEICVLSAPCVISSFVFFFCWSFSRPVPRKICVGVRCASLRDGEGGEGWWRVDRRPSLDAWIEGWGTGGRGRRRGNATSCLSSYRHLFDSILTGPSAPGPIIVFDFGSQIRGPLHF